MISTKRLIIRPYTENDAEKAHTWLSDPDVMRFIPGGHDTTPEQTLTRINKYMEHQEKHGFSKWVLTMRDNGEVIGDAGLMYLPGTEMVELGYRLKKEYWGKGLATEAAAAWINYGFKTIKLNCIYAITIPENLVSIHILRKFNFQSQGNVNFYDTDFLLFSICPKNKQ